MVAPEVRTVFANGLEFAFLEVGEGPLALCVHGFPDSPWTWRHLMPALAGAGFRAVAPFTRGFAPTQLPAPGTCNLANLTSDIDALHAALQGDDRAVVIGHDWGALGAYGVIQRPSGRWRRAVGLGVPLESGLPSDFLDYDQLQRAFYMFVIASRFGEAALSHRHLMFIDRLWEAWAPSYAWSEDSRSAKDCLRDPRHLSAVAGYYRSMLSAPAQADAPEPDVRRRSRILYVHGADDRRIPPRRDIAGIGRTCIVPGAGHFVHLERPVETAAAILDWICETGL